MVQQSQNCFSPWETEKAIQRKWIQKSESWGINKYSEAG